MHLLLERTYGLLFDPGLGKTSTVLHAIKTLQDGGKLRKALILAPRLVCTNVWPQEIEKWDQFSGLTYCQLRDSKADYNATIHLANPEYPRLLKVFSRALEEPEWPYDMLVIDESSKFKNPTSKRFKVLKKFLARFERRIILTGTFIPNSLQDVFSQVYILDRGKTFGRYITHFRNKYFSLDNPRFYTYKLKAGAEEEIQQKIAPLVMRLDAAKHLDLPELVHNEIKISLPEDVQEKYEEIEKTFFTEVDEEEILVLSSSGKYLLCRQMSNGAFYTPDVEIRETKYLHSCKTEALKDLIDELNGKPILVAYVYHADAELILKDLKRNIPIIGGQTAENEAARHIKKWNRGELPILLAQSAAIAHGLNLQAGGNDICFFSLTDHLEDYEQLIRRIYRQGVMGQVRIHYLICRDTIDEAVLSRIKTKERAERAMLSAIEEYRCSKTLCTER